MQGNCFHLYMKINTTFAKLNKFGLTVDGQSARFGL